MKKNIKILSYNIHKGFSSFNTKYILEKIRESIRETHADILCLQEIGETKKSNLSQFEYLADEIWPHFAYGKNAAYSVGHHGNAILSKFPILHSENLNLSTNRLEKRGMLHAKIEVFPGGETLHVLCTHLNLLEKSRKKQIKLLGEMITKRVPEGAPMILAGDFNDWREIVSEELWCDLELKEAYLNIEGTHSLTFPSWLPKLRVDRIYFRQVTPKKVHYFKAPIWGKLSDHLPVMMEFTFK